MARNHKQQHRFKPSRKPLDHPRSQYRNVFWAGYKHKTRPWGVRIHVRNSRSGNEFVNLGYYEDEETAARVADVGLILIHGADAKFKLNFDGRPPDSVPKAWIIDEIRRRLFTERQSDG